MLGSELVTTAAIRPNVIAGETPTLSPFVPASPDNLDKQHELGQFLAPNPVAEFMASLFEIHRSEVHLLDAGAGAGALSAALVGRLCRDVQKPKRISITAYEIDAAQFLGRRKCGVAEDPEHMIHFNDERFLGPYPDVLPPG